MIRRGWHWYIIWRCSLVGKDCWLASFADVVNYFVGGCVVRGVSYFEGRVVDAIRWWSFVPVVGIANVYAEAH